MIKAAAIWDADFFKWLEENLDAMLELEREALRAAVARACEIKAEVVGLDEREAGLRALLNFGHTLGHAVELAGGLRRVRHGEAVAIGMAFAARLSERRGLAPGRHRGAPGGAARARGPADGATRLPRRNARAYLRGIAVDKKLAGGARVRSSCCARSAARSAWSSTPEEILAGAE